MELKDLDKAAKLRVSLVETERALATIKTANVTIHITPSSGEPVILKAAPGALIQIIANLEADQARIRSEFEALGFTL